MSAFHATTVQVTGIEPAGETKVRIKLEMLVDVHRLAEGGSDMLHAAVKRAKDTRKKV